MSPAYVVTRIRRLGLPLRWLTVVVLLTAAGLSLGLDASSGAASSSPAYNLEGTWAFTLHNCKGKVATTSLVINQFNPNSGVFRFSDASAQSTGLTGSEEGNRVTLGSFGTGTVEQTGTSLTITIPLRCSVGSSGREVLVNTEPELGGAASSSPPGTLSAAARIRLIDDVEKAPGCQMPKVSVGSVDPTFKPTRGLTIATEVLPTGAGTPASLARFGLTGTALTGHGDETAYVKVYQPPNVPVAFYGSGTALTPSQQQEIPANATVVSAHGMYYTANGLVQVPPGVTITTFVPLGTLMAQSLGIHIDSGNLSGGDTTWEHTYGPGDLMPNFTFAPLDNTGGAGTTVSRVTTLSEILPDLKGNVDLASCAEVVIPANDTLDEALSNLPVHTIGTDEVTYLPSDEKVTITDSGELSVQQTTSSP